MALFSTNTGNQAKSIAAIEKFSGHWGKVVQSWKSKAPPQYEMDKTFASDLAQVASIAGKSLKEAKAGELGKSHVTLERVRDILADMRKRNGVVSFSDHVNAYHSQMEHVLKTSYQGDQRKLIADTGALKYLAAALKNNAPAEYLAQDSFKQGLAGINTSLAALEKAIAGKDRAAIGKARKKLKKPYAMFFIRWG